MRSIAVIALLAAAAAPLSSQEPDAEARLVRWLDGVAQEQLNRRAAAIARIRTVEDARRRQEYVRAKVLELLGGLPDYDGPLNAKTTGRLEHKGYAIEKVIFESLPRLHVTGNLYLPTAPGPHPAVLMPLGHWENGKPAVQAFAGNLALKGFVVLAYDPLGQGERLQAFDKRLARALAGGATDQHFMAGAQSLLAGESFARYRIWDAKRALDYLLSRPEVNKELVGCTGCSGGGTLTTYISALDPRIKAAAPACYMNSFRVLFPGSVGDSEQSLPDFLSSGLDQTDFVELFAPKPWLIASTIEDFFKLEGARQVYDEAAKWYRIFGARDKIAWTVGHGEHGTPREVREAIYEWFIRWLKQGKGDPEEQEVELHPDFELFATETGQVATSLGSRDIDDVIREEFEKRRKSAPPADLMETLRRWSPAPAQTADAPRVEGETFTAGLVSRRIVFEAEPGVELHAALLIPRRTGRKAGVVVVESAGAGSGLANRLARRGAIVLSLAPRGKPAAQQPQRLLGDWSANTRAWLAGRNLPGLRAHDIRRGLDVLAAHPDVDPERLRGAAREVAGVWLLMAAALDKRLGAVWLDKTPHSLRAALANPLHRNLHDAVLPGFILRWDLADLAKAIEPRRIVWSDPTDWMGTVQRLGPRYLYRVFEGPDEPYIDALLR